MSKAEGKKRVSVDESADNALIAKKDFVICHNDYFREIKAGEDLSDVPGCFHANLKTEEII